MQYKAMVEAEFEQEVPQFIMGVLAQVENGSKQFWK
jgi:hypothetical protein